MRSNSCWRMNFVHVIESNLIFKTALCVSFMMAIASQASTPYPAEMSKMGINVLNVSSRMISNRRIFWCYSALEISLGAMKPWSTSCRWRTDVAITLITTAPAFLLHNNLRNTPFTNDSKSDAIDSRYCDVFALLLLASYSIDHPNALLSHHDYD